MLNLNRESMKNVELWKAAGIEIPTFDRDLMIAKTTERPTWVHFGAGNLFRGFPAALQQTLLKMGKTDTGIIVVETFDAEIIEKVYKPYDNLSLLVVMNPDGSLKKEVIGSIGEALVGDGSSEEDWNRLKALFRMPSLQMVSLTITEKGYALKNIAGEYFDPVMRDRLAGPAKTEHIMSNLTALAYERYCCGKLPIAFVSMDNCSSNGKRLHDAVEDIAACWVEHGLIDSGFLNYMNDPSKVSFPWTMIDKITPRPSEAVRNSLGASGFISNEIYCTDKNTYIAPFVNAEGPEYLVVEDSFPNRRPPLERSGVLFTDRTTVSNVEKMKVCTCLNPLHTTLAVFGCLLGYTLIAEEMKDEVLKTLAYKVGYDEGLPVVVNPGIIHPEAFIREVLTERFTNPFIPDTPQRITSDTSLKVGIRFGETIKAYQQSAAKDPFALRYIPLVLAGWCRYLLGLDDMGQQMPLSPDPMLMELQACLSGVRLGDIDSIGDCLKPILANESIFGVNLYEVQLGEKIEGYFRELASGIGAVRATLIKHLK